MNDNDNKVKVDLSNGQMGENVTKLDPLKAKIPKNPNHKMDIRTLLDGAAEIGYRQCKQDILGTLIGIHDATPATEQIPTRTALKRIIDVLAKAT
jgi:hypothetical protein